MIWSPSPKTRPIKSSIHQCAVCPLILSTIHPSTTPRVHWGSLKYHASCAIYPIVCSRIWATTALSHQRLIEITSNTLRAKCTHLNRLDLSRSSARDRSAGIGRPNRTSHTLPSRLCAEYIVYSFVYMYIVNENIHSSWTYNWAHSATRASQLAIAKRTQSRGKMHTQMNINLLMLSVRTTNIHYPYHPTKLNTHWSSSHNVKRSCCDLAFMHIQRALQTNSHWVCVEFYIQYSSFGLYEMFVCAALFTTYVHHAHGDCQCAPTMVPIQYFTARTKSVVQPPSLIGL